MRGDKFMTTENKTVTQETVATKGQLTFDDKVIQKIVGYAIENVSGLLGVDGGFVANIKNKIVNSDNPTDGIDVEVGKEQVAVDLNIVMEFGHNAHDVYKEISKVIAKQIEEATSLTLVELNVKVIDIQTKSEFEESQVTIQDRVTDAGKSVQDKATAGIDKVKSVTDSDDARVQ